MNDLFRIESLYFVAGLICVENIVTQAAPIIRYMIGWNINKVRSYCEKRKWKLEEFSIFFALTI